MTKVDVILTGGSVATMNDGFDLFIPGAVAIREASIEAVGPADQIAAAYTADEVVDCSGCAVIPGLINAHTHAPMTLLRGLADDLRLDVWLMGYVMPVEREFVRPRFCWLGTQLACVEMIRSGTTCYADMYYYEEAVADATAGFSGAELEQMVIAGLFAAFSDDQRELTTEDILSAAADTQPLAKSRAREIAALIDWANQNAKQAG